MRHNHETMHWPLNSSNAAQHKRSNDDAYLVVGRAGKCPDFGPAAAHAVSAHQA